MTGDNKKTAPLFTFKCFQVFSDALSPSLLKVPIEILQDKKMQLCNKSHTSALEQVTPLAGKKGSINS